MESYFEYGDFALRTISAQSLQSMLAQQTSDYFVVLLDLDHSSLGSPIRLVNDYNDKTFGGNLYTAYPFEFTLPDDQEDREPEAMLIIDNTDRSLVDDIRAFDSPPTITAKVIRGDSTSDIEWGPIDFTVRGAQYNKEAIRFRLTFLNFTDEPFPFIQFTPRLFPGLY